MIHPTPYPELNSVLDELVASIRAALGETFVGAYLQGSFAVGDFDRHSDVDFVVVTARDLTDDQVRALQEVHPRIFSLPSEWAQHLEGSYFPAGTLRDRDLVGQPVWYLDHGRQSLVRSNHCNTLVVRSVLREHGVTLAGESPGTLVKPVPADALRTEILATIRDWGHQILEDPEQYRNRFYQGFIILNYCRMMHDLVNGRPGSKVAGAEWAKTTLDPAWSALIDRAWASRPNPAVAVREPADPTDFESTLQFVKYVIGESAHFTDDITP